MVGAFVATAALLSGVTSCGDRADVAARGPASTPEPTERETLLFPNDPAKVMQLAAGEGHVVVTRPTKTGSDLIDVTEPGKPVTLRSFSGAAAVPSIGTDATGRPVAVVSPCMTEDLRATPRCSLVAVDLATRSRSVIPKSRFAFAGDLDGGRAVIARYAADRRTVRVALAAAPESAAYEAVPIPAVFGPPASGSSGGASPESDTIGSIDLQGDVIAAAVLYGSPSDYGGSQLLRHTEGAGTGWRRLAGSGYGLMNGDRREWRAATVTPTGVRAVYDGGSNDDPYAARWDASGKRAKKMKLPLRFDVAYSAFDGDDLVSVDTGDFDFDGGPAEDGVRRSGPYPLG